MKIYLTNSVLFVNYMYAVHDPEKKKEKKKLIYFVAMLVGPFSDLMTNAKI